MRDTEPKANLEARVGKAETRLFLIECEVISRYHSWERRKARTADTRSSHLLLLSPECICMLMSHCPAAQLFPAPDWAWSGG